MVDKKLMGKKARAAGIRLELKVREDLEKKDWRSFRIESVLEFTPLDTPSEDFDA